MPGDTTYRVVLALETTGNLGQKTQETTDKLDAAEKKAHALRHALTSTAEAGAQGFHVVGHAIEEVADHLIHVVEHAALLGGGALFAGAVYGVAHLNNELEQTEISLAAIFQAQGFAGDFTSAMGMAGDELAKMKQDVKSLPGDLGQLSNVMKMIATPGAQGGMDPDAIRKLAGQTMLTSTILGVQQDVAAREMANLLAGRAGSHNILGSRLGLIGDAAKKFNAESATARVEDIEKLLAKYQGASDRFAQSFIANWTTLKDNIKYGFAAEASAPLFEAVKHTLASINTWFDENGGKVRSWAMTFGQHLTETWNLVTEEAEKFGPALDNLGHVFFELWDKGLEKIHEYQPFIDKIAAILEHVKPEDVIDAGKSLVEAKAIGMGLQGAGTAVSGGIGAANLYFNWRRAMGGGTTAATEGAEGAEGAAAAGAGEAGAAGLGLVGTALSTFALVGGISAYIGGVVEAFKDLHKVAESQEQKTADVNAEVEKFTANMAAANEEAAENDAVVASFRGALERVSKLLPTGPPPPIEENPGFQLGMHLASTSILEKTLGYSHATKKMPGGGGTNIQKVEIIVKGSDDPSRVARLTLEHLQRLGRNPTQSPDVPSFLR